MQISLLRKLKSDEMAGVSENYIHEKKKKLLSLCAVAEHLLQDLQRYFLNPINPSVDGDVTLANVFQNAF